MEFPLFAYIAILLLAALLSTRLMRIIKLPNVTGYIITGIIVGPFIFGLFFNHFSFDGIKEGIIYQYINRISWVSTVALGFIAFSIGTSFKLKNNAPRQSAIDFIKAMIDVTKKHMCIAIEFILPLIGFSNNQEFDPCYLIERVFPNLDKNQCTIISEMDKKFGKENQKWLFLVFMEERMKTPATS